MAFKHYPQISKEDIPSMNIENMIKEIVAYKK